MARIGYVHETCESNRADKVAARIEEFEKHGWPLWIVRLLDSNPGVSLHEAILDHPYGVDIERALVH
jgi:hypothetical protein